MLGQATFFNQNFAWPFTTTRNLENTDTNEDTSEIIVYYWSEDFSAFLGSHNITTGEFHVPETDITALPSAATIGQSGTLGRYESLTDDNYYTLQWSIAQETETTAKLTFLRGYSDTTIEQQDFIILSNGTRTNATWWEPEIEVVSDDYEVVLELNGDPF